MTTHSAANLTCGVILALSLVACAPPKAGPDASKLGRPRAGLSAQERALFDEGQELFQQQLPGLGPLFNDVSCAACHSIPVTGGAGDLEHLVFLGPGEGGTGVREYPKHALPGWTVPVRSPDATPRIPPALFGLGYIELIPDDAIRAACGAGHPNSANDSIVVTPNRVARFGTKPFTGTVKAFIAAALAGESGVTNRIEDNTDDDASLDPEVDDAYISALTAYLTGLEAPGRDGTDAEGERLFAEWGCATCHPPDLPHAPNVFSDLCLHRMGPALADGISDHEAQGDEFRSAPLQGLRFRTRYLHDGRAAQVADAILAHDGEAAGATAAYLGGSGSEREALLRFLDTL